MSDLHERLIAAKLTGHSIPDDGCGYVLHRRFNDAEAAHIAAKVFAEHLKSDATVERVARALFEESGVWQSLGPWWFPSESVRDHYRDGARAALAAAMAGGEES